jgi:hypothetical protein
MTSSPSRWDPLIGLSNVVLAVAILPVLALIGFALLLAGPGYDVYEVYPSPDRTLSWVRVVDLGGATIQAQSDVAIVGPTFDHIRYVGGYEGWSWSRADGWRGQQSLNVCGLTDDLTRPQDRVSDVEATTSTGAIAAIHVTRDCR